MRLTGIFLILLGATVFAIGVAFMILTLTWISAFDADAAASGSSMAFRDGARMLAFAIAGYLVAAAGTSLARNAGRELKSLGRPATD